MPLTHSESIQTRWLGGLVGGVRVISGRWVRCRHRSGERTQRAAGQRSYRGTVPAAGQAANCRTGAGADRAATESTLPRIIGIAAGGQRQYDAERCTGTRDQS
jgi:hypothetical protein